MKFSPNSKKESDQSNHLSDFIKSYKQGLKADSSQPIKSSSDETENTQKKSPREALRKSFAKFYKIKKSVNSKIKESSSNISDKVSANKTFLNFLSQFKLIRKFTILDYIILVVLLIIFLFSSVYLLGPKVFSSTFKKVAVDGGDIEEIMIGQPQHINPLSAYPVADHASSVEDSLVSLIYSSPMKLTASGDLEEDGLKSLEILDNNKKYILHVRDDINFHDGKQLTADDILFTINLIKDPSFNTSKASILDWKNIQTNLIDDYTLELTQEEENPIKELLTFGIFPKHLWEDATPTNISSYGYNIKPRGSGPFRVRELEKNNLDEITGIVLERNPDYYNEKPKIESIKFVFFKDQEELEKNSNDHKNANYGYFQDTEEIDTIKGKENLIQTTRYFSLFFNMKSGSGWSNETKLRKALTHAINREDIINEVFQENAFANNAPIPPNSKYSNSNLEFPNYSPSQALSILDELGWKKENKESEYLSKNNEILAIKITVRDNATLQKIAEMITKQLSAVGIQTQLIVLNKSDWEEAIFNKQDYELLLHGTSLRSSLIDLYSFWHSSQINNGGFNFSRYKNSDIDNALQTLRTSNEEDKIRESLFKFQEVLNSQIPSIDIVSQSYVYLTNKNIKGEITTEGQILVKPRDRFATIDQWRLKEKIIVE